MRAKMNVDGKNRVCDTEKSEKLAYRSFGEFGDPAGYEEWLYKTRTNVTFAYGVGGPESPYPEESLRAVDEFEAKEWLGE